MISGDCPSTPIASSFTMPDCYGLTPGDCLTSMNWLGFTGTLETTVAGTADYTVPAGTVLSTNPAAYAGGVSTAASTVADAYTNPRSCELDSVDNPHWSTTSDTMLAYVYVLCNFTGEATFAATMYQCEGDPGTNGANLATASCVVAASTTSNNWTPVVADEIETVDLPWVSEGDPPVAWSPGYWIANGVTTTPNVLNGPEVWSQSGWQPPSP